MNATIHPTLGPTIINVTLSRRNLKALLASLDVNPGATISRSISPSIVLALTPQEDAEHYGVREPGRMPEAVEAQIA